MLPTSKDHELQPVVAALHELDPQGSRTAQVLRDTLDQLYDGQRTGRYRWDQLFKTEKTHFGTLVEINLQREFKFQNGEKLDYRIDGIEVDCKYSQTRCAWMIPPEARGHLCLVLCAEDSANPTWSMGVVRVDVDRLNAGGNRDAKSTLNEAGRRAITWLFDDAPLPPNVLLQLPQEAVDRIMSKSSGVQKTNELFRVALGMRVGRAVVATVSEQVDYMRRIRYGGGARGYLQPEGIIILGQYQSHVAVARSLGLPLPGQGESVSARIAPAQQPGSGVAEIGGKLWRIAKPADPVVPAPILPEV
ncbi:MAG TPA: NaeI family type II restriction endonuclease [Verrucomicrobiae bacterium]|nr:NaeI family type II restriction endonuclease [Verrucomicrobiae bacterium]